MTHGTLHGGCHCGTLRVAVELPRPAASYAPRACDCDYCRKHGAAYVSDPAGRLHIEVRDPAALGRYRQGNGLAEFLFCKNCGVLVAVAYAESGRTWATINHLTLEAMRDFAAATPVSPRTLSAGDKVARWKATWFPQMTFSMLSGDPSAPPTKATP